MRRTVVVGIAAAALLWCADSESEVWKFDSITKIGGHAVTAEGHPRVIATPAGKAVEFGGVDDALFLKVHPLAGADDVHLGSDFPARRGRRGGAALLPLPGGRRRRRACCSRSA